MFAILLPVILTSAGLAVDLGQAYLVKARLQGALDSAALAGAASSADPQEIEDRIDAFFMANYPDDRIGNAYDLQVNINGDIVNVSARADYDTKFMRILGKDEMTVAAGTTINREVRGIEVALVLDVTGSMASNNNIGSLRTATLNFIDIIFDRVSSSEDIRVGLVPYAVAVNAGQIAPTIVSDLPQYDFDDDGDEEDVPYNYIDDSSELTTDIEWHGCVMARDYPDDTLDTDTFTGGEWEPYWWESTNSDNDDNRWDPNNGGYMRVPYDDGNNRRTPNLGCPEYNPIVPLTSDQTALETAASNLVYWSRGGTLGNLGMSWGYRVLSPEEPFTEGAAWDDNEWVKVVVMMTDGDNQLWRKPGIDASSDFSAYDRISEGVLGTTSRDTGLDIVNDRFAETCAAMKDAGITIYTVTFSNGANSDTRDLYRSCATDADKYFDAPSQNDLIDVFEEISRELANLHVSS